MRPSAAWLSSPGLIVLALVGGSWSGRWSWEATGRPVRLARTTERRRHPEPGCHLRHPSPSAASAAPVATPACKTAVDRANAMLASAVKLRGALAEQDQFLSDPANQGLEVAEVLRRLAAAREAATGEGERFDRALDAYREVVDQCDLRAP